MKLSIVCLLVTLLSTTNVRGQHEADSTLYWVKTSYLSCLNDSLPCNCWDFRSSPILIFNLEGDKIKSVWNDPIINFTKAETTSFDIIDQMTKLIQQKDSIIAHVEIVNDTIFYTKTESNISIIYIPEPDRFNFENRTSLNFLNALLQSHGHQKLEKILNTNSLTCDCDVQYGINRVYDDKKMWIVKIKNNELLIYKWEYPKNREGWTTNKPFKKFELSNE